MHSRHDEYHKLTRGERIGYGMGDFAQNLVFGTIGGFLALHMLTVNTISTATAGFIFLFVRIINVFWDPMVGTYVDKRTSKAGKYRPWLLRAGVPLVILSALLFAPIPGERFGGFRLYYLSGAGPGLFLSQYSLWLAECVADPRPGIDR
jgi:GPH family glycoside/pentoside/hexuronide:cation symporter